MAAIEGSGMAVLAHPAGTGAFLRGQGMSPHFVYGTLLRLAGADGVIYTNAGGRFPFDEAECELINQRARAPLGKVRPSLPIAGGGIDAGRIEYWTSRYGVDVGFLIGSSLYAQPDLGVAAAQLMALVRSVTSP
jgi:ribulose-bisphosphate carboxylase large chain